MTPSRPAKINSAKPLSELSLIADLRLQAEGRFRYLRAGIGDDCAILIPPSGHEILITTDFSLEGRHFRRDWHSARSAGHRVLARGLSDLASMGAAPLAAFLSLALPRGLARKPAWVEDFLSGLLALAKEHRTPLAGGDTSESPSDAVLADIVLLGSAPRGRALLRSTARPGDTLYVTGALGGASAELAALSEHPRRFRSAQADGDHPHLFPQPRLGVGQALLRRKLATACIDISDGLSTDLAHLCKESGVSAQIEAASLPIHSLAKKFAAASAQTSALHGGEDYELLFTAKSSTRVPRAIAGVPVTRIGTIGTSRRNAPQVTLLETSGKRIALRPQGWEHLK
jgi:thiamine-monophosphate kinase